MSSLATPAVPTAPPKHRAIDAFVDAVAWGNPFSHHRVTATGAQPVDVPSIHDGEFRKLTDFARQARDQNEAIGVVVWGESGSGKSNLIRRLGEWASSGKGAYLVNFLELQASPDKLHRTVLNAVVSALTNGFSPPWHSTPLYQLLQGLIRPAVTAGKKTLSPAELGRVFRAQMAKAVAEAGNAPAVRTAVELLLRFLSAAIREKTHPSDDGLAAAVLRRLGGDGVDEEEAKALALRPADVGEPLDPADSLRILAVVAQLAWVNNKTLILCFDQINTLPRSQIGEVARLLHDLNDRLRNTVLLLSEVQASLLELTNAGVIAQATWDRLSANKIEMKRVTVLEGRRILEARLDRFLQPFKDVSEVAAYIKPEKLFPLGDGWFREYFKDSLDARPRRMIDAARERWEDLKESLLESADKQKWLASWPGVDVISPPNKTHEQLIDEQVDKAYAARLSQNTADPKALPPNADNLRGLAGALLEAGGIGLAVERTPPGSPYHLVLRTSVAGGGERTTGLTFLGTGSATSATATLRHLAGGHNPPDRSMLVTDKRLPVAFGRAPNAQGRNHYAALKATAGFEHVELPFVDYAALEALDKVARQAGELEIDPPGGPRRTLKKDEVIASYRRKGRLKAHPLLGRFMDDGHLPPVVVILVDAEVRQFIFGRLAITMGTDTHELATRLLSELSADRRAGLDAASCRVRIEEVAKQMAAAKQVRMSPLGGGYFLLPLQQTAV